MNESQLSFLIVHGLPSQPASQLEQSVQVVFVGLGIPIMIIVFG